MGKSWAPLSFLFICCHFFSLSIQNKNNLSLLTSKLIDVTFINHHYKNPNWILEASQHCSPLYRVLWNLGPSAQNPGDLGPGRLVITTVSYQNQTVICKSFSSTKKTWFVCLLLSSAFIAQSVGIFMLFFSCFCKS